MLFFKDTFVYSVKIEFFLNEWHLFCMHYLYLNKNLVPTEKYFIFLHLKEKINTVT